MRRIILICGIVILLTFTLALAEEEPPSLTDFEQFFGKVSDLPSGTYTLKAVFGDKEYTTFIAQDKRFGFSTSFKIYWNEATEIIFYVVDELNVETEVGRETYQNKAVKELDLQYPTDIIPSAEEEAEALAAEGEEELEEGVMPGEVTPPSGFPIKVCTANAKRCRGKELQQCSFDGQEWEVMESCEDGCDSTRLRCKAVVPAEVAGMSIYLWLGGGLVLLVIIALIVYFLRKKSQPEYGQQPF